MKIFLCFVLSIVSSLKPSVFQMHSRDHMLYFFNELQEYAFKKSSLIPKKCSDSDMLLEMSRQLNNGIEYLKKQDDSNITYMSWTPLMTQKSQDLEKFKPLVLYNDNEDLQFFEVPLVFLILDSIDENKFEVSKIYQNPSILMKLDVELMFTHLQLIEKKSNVTFDCGKLKYAQGGRWNLELELNRLKEQ